MELALLVTLALIVTVAICILSMSRPAGDRSSRPPLVLPVPQVPPDAPEAPQRLEVQARARFFTRPEQALYLALQEALRGTPYAVFPKVRLSDLFTTGREAPKGTHARLRDKHVDFLVVCGPEQRPLLGLELVAEVSPDSTPPRDILKDVAFRSAGLSLVQMPARPSYAAAQMRLELSTHLPLLRNPGTPDAGSEGSSAAGRVRPWRG